jgi:hypothetical protein
MKTLVTMAFALILGAFALGFAGNSNASPASTATITATQVESLKSEPTQVRWWRRRCYTRCYTRCWRPRPVCNPCCGGGGWFGSGFLFF